MYYNSLHFGTETKISLIAASIMTVKSIKSINNLMNRKYETWTGRKRSNELNEPPKEMRYLFVNQQYTILNNDCLMTTMRRKFSDRCF